MSNSEKNSRSPSGFFFFFICLGDSQLVSDLAKKGKKKREREKGRERDIRRMASVLFQKYKRNVNKHMLWNPLIMPPNFTFTFSSSSDRFFGYSPIALLSPFPQFQCIMWFKHTDDSSSFWPKKPSLTRLNLSSKVKVGKMDTKGSWREKRRGGGTVLRTCAQKKGRDPESRGRIQGLLCMSLATYSGLVFSSWSSQLALPRFRNLGFAEGAAQ